MKKFLFVSVLMMAMFITGCGIQPLTGDALTRLDDSPILFMDDFNKQTGGWQTYADRLSYAGYTQDGFRLWIDMPHFLVWSVPGLNFKDTHVYTLAQKVAGPDDNLFGLICRYQNKQNYYAFVISSDGYYAIYRRQAGVLNLLGLSQMGFSEVIQRSGQANEILAVCQGDQLALLVNDTKLLQVTDDTFDRGDVGLIAGNMSKPGVDVLFKYFIVVKP